MAGRGRGYEGVLDVIQRERIDSLMLPLISCLGGRDESPNVEPEVSSA